MVDNFSDFFMQHSPVPYDIKQIYHVKEGYLRKIPVERMLNFTSRKAREIHSQGWYFSHQMLTLKNTLMTVMLQASSRVEYFLANTMAERVKKYTVYQPRILT